MSQNSCKANLNKEKRITRLSFPLSKNELVCILFLVLFSPRLFAQIPPGNFSSVTVSSNWTQAVGLTFSKNGNQMFVWEKAGKVWVVENNKHQRRGRKLE